VKENFTFFAFLFSCDVYEKFKKEWYENKILSSEFISTFSINSVAKIYVYREFYSVPRDQGMHSRFINRFLFNIHP
jgi:hypothetical protein